MAANELRVFRKAHRQVCESQTRQLERSASNCGGSKLVIRRQRIAPANVHGWVLKLPFAIAHGVSATAGRSADGRYYLFTVGRRYSANLRMPISGLGEVVPEPSARSRRYLVALHETSVSERRPKAFLFRPIPISDHLFKFGLGRIGLVG
jgi:hypothetical protein